MIIQHNIMALNSYNKLSTNNSSVQKNLEKLSSGYRINRAGDDAAGLAISEKMRAQITGLERAKLNAQDGISLVQTAEGALTEVHSILNRLVELGTESANGIYQADDRQKIQDEVNQSLEEIDRISKATNFNGINLLDGSLSAAGAANQTGGNTVTLDAKGLGVKLSKDEQIYAATKSKWQIQIAAAPAAGDPGVTAATAMKANDVGTYQITYVDESGATQVKNVTVKVTAVANQAVALAGKLSDLGFIDDAADASNGNELNLQSTTAGSNGAKIQDVRLISYGASTGAETAVVNPKAATGLTQTAFGEDEYRSNKVVFDKDFQAGNTVTIGNKTYEFVDQANIGDVAKDRVAVVLAANGADANEKNNNTIANLVQALNKNGVNAKVGAEDAKTILVDDLSQISLNSKNVSFSSSTANITGGDAEAKKGAWKMTAGIGTAGAAKLTIRYKDEEGKEKTKVLDYTATANNVTNATAMKNAIMADEEMKKLFTVDDRNGGTAATQHLRIEANTKGSKGAQIMAITTSDTLDTAITDEVKVVAKGTDTGKGVTVKNGVQVGDTVTIGGKTFEFVNSDGAKKAGSGNIAVILGNTTDKTTENLNAALVNAGFETEYTKGMSSLKITGGAAASGSGEGGLTLQIGDTADDYNKVTVSVDDMSSSGLGIDSLQVTDQGVSADSITKVKSAIEKVSTNRGRLGALQNRLEHTINNLSTTTENMTAAESRVRDTDMAKEMMAFTKNNVLVQAAQSMLAQANQQPQQVLQLLR